MLASAYYMSDIIVVAVGIVVTAAGGVDAVVLVVIIVCRSLPCVSYFVFVAIVVWAANDSACVSTSRPSRSNNVDINNKLGQCRRGEDYRR